MANIQYLWKTPQIAQKYTTAVSLHGHTLYSRESLSFVIQHSKQIRLLRMILRNQEKRCTAIKPDFLRGYWTPPLGPRSAYEVERIQIEKRLGLTAIVSLTDHDNIEAPMRLQLLEQTRMAPVSLEWTVPLENSKVHLGVHNLSRSTAGEWVAAMQAYTADHRRSSLEQLLAGLNAMVDVLIVLNHPMWDLFGSGYSGHVSALQNFLQKYNAFIHAFELGGLRSWNENQRVVNLACAWNKSLISGGDRHGCEPNAVLNLTNAASFSEFIREIRQDRQSNIVFMPQYQQSHAMRMIHTINSVTGLIPGNPFGPRWDERTFHPDSEGEMQPLAALWPEIPRFIRIALAALRTVEAEPIKVGVQHLCGGSRNSFRLRPLREDRETL